MCRLRGRLFAWETCMEICSLVGTGSLRSSCCTWVYSFTSNASIAFAERDGEIHFGALKIYGVVGAITYGSKWKIVLYSEKEQCQCHTNRQMDEKNMRIEQEDTFLIRNTTRRSVIMTLTLPSEFRQHYYRTPPLGNKQDGRFRRHRHNPSVYHP